MKTAAVYDRWLYTLGGGEQVAFRFAEMLRDLGYTTTILTHKQVDVKKAEDKLFVDLENIAIEYLPLLSSIELSQYTEQYDVFINTSYLDYFPNRAKIGILSVFFPSKIRLSLFEYIKRAFIVPSFRRFFIYPTIFEGFLYDQYTDGKIYKWLGKRSTIHFSDQVSALSMSVYFKNFAFSTSDAMQFYLGEDQVFPRSRRLHHTKNIVQFTFHFEKSAGKPFVIVLPQTKYAKDIALLQLTIGGIRFALYNKFKQLFPVWEMRLHGGPGVTKRADLLSYNRIVTISNFSQKWIHRYWGLPSTVLYPTTGTARFAAAKKKKNHIIHIGRFFVTGHSKKQLELVKAFTKLVSEHDVHDWELHFVGSVHEGEGHAQYFESVKRSGEGYPVFFHTDVSFDELRQLLSEAKIYWHATGLDENEDVQPILFEHFGITTVEAMASGCVPVVINAGGQKEIVTSESGFLWNTREELIRDTVRLMQDPALLHKLSTGALERSRFFDHKQGVERFSSLLKELS